jgi:S-DNA-T family DNA segregation ATPase FtsK/SpoIIIE
MSVIDRGFDFSLLSEQVRGALWRRMQECVGFALLGVAFLGAVALGTWSVQDPSFSHATDAKVRNLLGIPGAITADLLMQLIGVAAIVLLLPIAVWGWRLVTHRPMRRERWRLLAWLCAVVLGAVFAACMPRTHAWPLPTGLGGVVGDGLLRLPRLLAGGALSDAMRFATAIVTGVAGFAALMVTFGLGWHDRVQRQLDAATRERREQG